tara:strand:+ start:1059 stop:1448 length:390 start_codon:yes stop_codon:yes gene_type:complete
MPTQYSGKARITEVNLLHNSFTVEIFFNGSLFNTVTMEIPQVENGSLSREVVEDQLMEALQDEANKRAEKDRLDAYDNSVNASVISELKNIDLCENTYQGFNEVELTIEQIEQLEMADYLRTSFPLVVT